MYKNILLAVDLNEESSWAKALPTTVEYCKAFKSELHLMTVVPDFGMNVVRSFFPDDFADQAVAETRKALDSLAGKSIPDGIPVSTFVGYGSIYEEILSAAKKMNADLIIMASHGPHAKDYLLGPNAARVVRHADCSVLVVRNQA
ncbi:MAG: universal stress protein [Rhodospirillales bacterium]|nr:universal stress protein [Rhodospirillales bacterium]